MANTSNATVVDKAGPKSGAGEKVLEKRRALGRGLESLLPGPRVVTPASPAPAQTPASRGEALPDAASGHRPAVISPTAAGERGAEVAVISAASEADDTMAAPDANSVSAGNAQRAVTGQSLGDGVVQLEIASIDNNPHQTRMSFLEAKLQELSESIRAQGVLQPIVVRPSGDGRYLLILGERRLRASAMAGLKTIPALVRRVSDQQAAEMTLVENLQRQDLNCVDQASAFANLSQKFHLTQEQIGARVGVSRETVSNYLRLLNLPSGVLEALIGGRLTYSHARVLLTLGDHTQIWSFAKKAIAEGLSVAKLEALVMGNAFGAVKEPKAESGGARWLDPNVKAAQRSLETVLGMRVRIRDRAGRGKILIEYNTIDDFDRVVKMLQGK